ncbi:hypothetical protein TIFTF001_029170 [Ficus carica]|uniref:RNase H type-1 domain-containing protein n=1 Tax=Ficus carica TaxID=3494 RepID=A0AA88DRW7_FICCA|nr:hypothetical protein TIFTF001_029170 [Ficus carica]
MVLSQISVPLPPPWFFKLNVDAAISKNYNFAGIGAVIRDSSGALVACFLPTVQGFFSPHIAECLALREGLQFVKNLGMLLI